MNKTLSNEYRELIGGQHSIPFIGYALFIPSTTLSSILANWRFVEDGHFGEVLIANLLAIFASIGVYCLFKETVYRNRAIKPVSPWLVALFGISIGFTKGFITSYSLYFWGLHRTVEEAIFPNSIVTALLGLIIAPGVGVISSFLHKFKAERAHLLLEIINQDARVSQAQGAPGPEAIDKLNKFLAAAQDSLKNADSSTTNEVARKIRRLNFDILRPVSHQIWQEENRKLVDYSFSDLHKFMLREYLFKSKYIGLIYGLGSLGFSIQHLGLLPGITYTIVASLILAAIFGLAGKFETKTTNDDLARLIFAMLLTILMQSSALLIIHAHGFNNHMVSGVLLNIFWLLTVGYIVGLCIAAFRTHEEIEAKLKKFLGKDVSTLRNTTAISQIANREFANYLHGDVQNHLLQAALEFENDQFDPRAIESKLNKLRDYLDKIESSYSKRSVKNVSAEILSLAQAWDGIVKVDIAIDGSASKALSAFVHPADQSLLSAISEAISNASRHGFADQITIRLTCMPGKVVIVCEDNGTGPRDNYSKGLGTRLFDEVSKGDWRLTTAANGGARLQFNIPTS